MRTTETPFGGLLRRLRSAAGLSQEALAERAGLSRNGISELERGLHATPHLETVRLLADGLGLGDADRAALLAAARPSLLGTTPRPAALPSISPLPTPLTRLIGRREELAELCRMLRDHSVRLVTVAGPGGVGKTRLAIAVAAELAGAYPAGVCFVDLSPLSDPALVIPAIATALGVSEIAGQPLLRTLSTVLARRRLLLLIDNGERVLTAATDVVALLSVCPPVSILATSREPFRVRGEFALNLAPLPLPDECFPTVADMAQNPSIALFVERASAVQPNFALNTANAVTVAAICQRLDGLPLAIELAAARLKVLPLAALLARLEQRLPLLGDGARDQPVRLRSMRDAIAWSYDLLSDCEARCFRRLAVFVGGFTLEAAEAIGCGLNLISSLIDKSLLQPTDPHGPAPRFTMLETIREFAGEVLAASGEAAVIAKTHAAWCVQFATRIRRGGGLSSSTGLNMLEVEHPNLRAALTWLLERGETTTALHLAGELAEFWQRHGHLAEGTAWLERALASDRGEATAARARALVGLNMLLWDRDALTQAARLVQEAEAVARAAGDAGALAYARLHQGYVAAFQGDLDLAEDRGEEALTACAAIPQDFSDHGALWLLGFVALVRREDERATELHERLLALARAQGDEVSIADGHFGLALLAERRGDLHSALAGYAEAATTCQRFDQKAVASYFLEAAAATAIALGSVEPAVRLLGAAESMRAAVGARTVHGMHVDSTYHLQSLDTARASLGTKRFAAAWTAGMALSFTEAIAEVAALARAVAEDPNNGTVYQLHEAGGTTCTDKSYASRRVTRRPRTAARRRRCSCLGCSH